MGNDAAFLAASCDLSIRFLKVLKQNCGEKKQLHFKFSTRKRICNLCFGAVYLLILVSTMEAKP